jgi:hypothetical protein
MKNQAVSVKYGIGIGLALIGIFLLLSVLGLHTKPFYSAVNIIIVAAGLYASIRVYKTEHQNDNLKNFTYQKGFRVGIITGFLATIVFTVFFAIYTSNIQPDFIEEMMVNWDSGYEVGVGTVSFIVFLMGLATTVVLSLAFMQIMKDSWNTTPGKRYTVSGTDDQAKK